MEADGERNPPRHFNSERDRASVSCAFGLVLGNEAVERRFNDYSLAKATERCKAAAPNERRRDIINS